MPRRFDLIVFDWDGTLMDSATAIAEAIQLACADLGYPVPADQDARYIIGLGLADAIAHILPGLESSQHGAVAERYRHHFLRRDSGTRLFAGAGESVRELHAAGYLLGVATGKSRRGLDRSLAATGLTPFFHATRCADEGYVKPDPRMLLALLKQLSMPPERALMIGDTSHDLLMAQAAKVAALGVTFGAHPGERLRACGPIECLDTWTDLRKWLNENA